MCWSWYLQYFWYLTVIVTLGGCAGLDIYNIFVYLNVIKCKNISLWEGVLVLISTIFVYLNVIARIFHFGRVCWSWYLQYFCIFDCYCKNISLWEGVLVLKSTISLYICILACYCKNISMLESCWSWNIFVYLTVIVRIFHFGRVCWSWYLQYFCIFEY